MYCPPDDTVPFESPKLLDQHLLRNLWYGSFQFRKPKNGIRAQTRNNNQLPPPLQACKSFFHFAGPYVELPITKFFFSGCHTHISKSVPCLMVRTCLFEDP